MRRSNRLESVQLAALKSRPLPFPLDIAVLTSWIVQKVLDDIYQMGGLSQLSLQCLAPEGFKKQTSNYRGIALSRACLFSAVMRNCLIIVNEILMLLLISTCLQIG